MSWWGGSHWSCLEWADHPCGGRHFPPVPGEGIGVYSATKSLCLALVDHQKGPPPPPLRQNFPPNPIEIGKISPKKDTFSPKFLILPRISEKNPYNADPPSAFGRMYTNVRR